MNPNSIDDLTTEKRPIPFLIMQKVGLTLYLTFGVLFAYGYRFPGTNHTTLVLPILARLDPELFQRDFFVQEMLNGFTPRYYYHELIYLMIKAGFKLSTSHFVLYLLALGSFILGLRAIAKLFCRSELSVALYVFWSLTVTTGFIGGNGIFGHSSFPGILAIGIAIWGLYFSFCRRWSIAFAFFGAACLLQFLVGLLPALLVLPLLLFDMWQARQWRKAFLPLFFLGIGAGMVYVPMIIGGATSTELLSSSQFVDIYGHFRHPHHVVPSQWGIHRWTQFLFFYIAGILCLLKINSLLYFQKRYLLGIIGVMFLGIFINFLFVEVWPWSIIAKLQLARMTAFSELAILASLALLFDNYFKEKQWFICTLLVIAPVAPQAGLILLILSLFIWFKADIFSKLTSKFSDWIISGISFSSFIFIEELTPKIPELWPQPRIEMALLWLVLVVPYFAFSSLSISRLVKFALFSLGLIVFFGVSIGALDKQIRFSHFIKDAVHRFNPFGERVVLYRNLTYPQARVARKFQKISEKDALVLIPPSASYFQFYSQRSVVVAFKSFPYTDQGILDWKNRFEKIFGIEANTQTYPQLYRGGSDILYQRESASKLIEVAQFYGAEYILSNPDWHPNMPGNLVVKDKVWAIWTVNDAD